MDRTNEFASILKVLDAADTISSDEQSRNAAVASKFLLVAVSTAQVVEQNDATVERMSIL